MYTDDVSNVHWCVVCSKAVLVVAVVDSYLDRDGCVNQSNDGRWDADEVGVSAVGGASESTIVG